MPYSSIQALATFIRWTLDQQQTNFCIVTDYVRVPQMSPNPELKYWDQAGKCKANLRTGTQCSQRLDRPFLVWPSVDGSKFQEAEFVLIPEAANISRGGILLCYYTGSCRVRCSRMHDVAPLVATPACPIGVLIGIHHWEIEGRVWRLPGTKPSRHAARYGPGAFVAPFARGQTVVPPGDKRWQLRLLLRRLLRGAIGVVTPVGQAVRSRRKTAGSPAYRKLPCYNGKHRIEWLQIAQYVIGQG
ncbi:hypothetical protein LSAT2_010543, partial [Lamellibrachia satsuma]